jgi:hypothetical protein
VKSIKKFVTKGRLINLETSYLKGKIYTLISKRQIQNSYVYSMYDYVSDYKVVDDFFNKLSINMWDFRLNKSKILNISL